MNRDLWHRVTGRLDRKAQGRKGHWLSLIAAVSLLAGCTSSPQVPADYDAVAVVAPDAVATVGDWSIRITQAQFAFGPVYFCASASGSSNLCEASIAEVASIVRLDGLFTSAQPLGAVHGFTGTIRSAAYDWGITWFDTQSEATPAEAASEGHSMHVEGTATHGSTVVPLVADVDVVPQYQGQMAVPTATAEATIDSAAFRLEVHFDVARWFEQLDRRTADGIPYLDALSSGGKIVIAPGTPAHEALLIGMKNLAPPEFQWVPTGK